MSFFIHPEAAVWFKNLSNSVDNFKTQFDSYYFCLLIGLASGKKAVEMKKTAEITDTFPLDYSPRSKVIIALFLKRVLDDMGISSHERQVISDNLSRFLRADSPTSLTAEAHKELDRYAYAGFEILSTTFQERPTDMPSFLIKYMELLKRQISVWQGASLD